MGIDHPVFSSVGPASADAPITAHDSECIHERCDDQILSLPSYFGHTTR